jgi:hypothetical protein
MYLSAHRYSPNKNIAPFKRDVTPALARLLSSTCTGSVESRHLDDIATRYQSTSLSDAAKTNKLIRRAASSRPASSKPASAIICLTSLKRRLTDRHPAVPLLLRLTILRSPCPYTSLSCLSHPRTLNYLSSHCPPQHKHALCIPVVQQTPAAS